MRPQNVKLNSDASEAKEKFTLIYLHKLGFGDTIVHPDQFVCLEFVFLGGLFLDWFRTYIERKQVNQICDRATSRMFHKNVLTLAAFFKLHCLHLKMRFSTLQNVPVITCVWIGFFITSFIIFIGKQQSNICVFLFFKNPNNIQKCVSVL